MTEPPDCFDFLSRVNDDVLWQMHTNVLLIFFASESADHTQRPLSTGLRNVHVLYLDDQGVANLCTSALPRGDDGIKERWRRQRWRRRAARRRSTAAAMPHRDDAGLLLVQGRHVLDVERHLCVACDLQ